MGGFEVRKTKGQVLEEYFVNYLEKNNIDYFRTGYENLTSSSGALDKLKNIENDNTSYLIRYLPDFVIIVHSDIKNDYVSRFVDVKASTGIERECYEHYIELEKTNGDDVLLFLYNKKWCFLKDLKLKKISEHDEVANMNVPVCEGIWKTPRKMDKEDYRRYMEAYRKADRSTSGCAFAYFDMDNITFYELSKLRNTK